MKIPPETLTLYLTEIAGKPAVDNRKAEPVGESARLGGTPSSLDSDRPMALSQELPENEDGKREPNKKTGTSHSGEERRKEDRRKETCSVLLDTRTSRSRRESSRSESINFKI